MTVMPLRKSLFVLLLSSLAWVFLCVSASVLLDPARAFKLLFGWLVCFAAIRPTWAIGAFLVLMPWVGGSQPGDLHTHRFLLLLSGLGLGTVLNALLELIVRSRSFVIPWPNPLVFAMFVFWVVTALSLSSVHPNGILWGLVTFNPALSRDFLRYDEAYEIYPWVSFVSLSIAFWLFIYLFNLFRLESKLRMVMLQCLGFGALLTIFAGLLDYFDFIDLVFVRPPGAGAFRFERLTAMFGNPTWYAQYVTLCAPTILAILLLPWRRVSTLGFMLAVMVVTEFCIILINQRGGWLAYPLTLVVVWFCVYVLNADQAAGQQLWAGLRRSWLKIAVTLPLTLVLSLSVVYLVAQSDALGKQKVLGFVDRVQTIKNTNDRLAYLEPTLKLLNLHPVLGGGVDAFRHQYEKAFMFDGHPCVHDDPYTTASRGSAHNLYFQTLVGKGVVGLLSLLGVMLSAIYLCWRGVFAHRVGEGVKVVTREQRIALMSGFAFTLALAIYSNVGEIFYTPVNYVVFALFCAVTASAGDGVAQVSVRWRWGILGALLLFLGWHLYLERFGALTC